MNVPETLKTIREKYGITQKEASELLEMPKRTYENWESGSRTPSEWVFKLVVDCLERRASNTYCNTQD